VLDHRPVREEGEVAGLREDNTLTATWKENSIPVDRDEIGCEG
jgi:hypothetical protein